MTDNTPSTRPHDPPLKKGDRDVEGVNRMADDVRQPTILETLCADLLAVICAVALLYVTYALAGEQGVLVIAKIAAGIACGSIAVVLLCGVVRRWTG